MICYVSYRHGKVGNLGPYQMDSDDAKKLYFHLASSNDLYWFCIWYPKIRKGWFRNSQVKKYFWTPEKFCEFAGRKLNPDLYRK